MLGAIAIASSLLAFYVFNTSAAVLVGCCYAMAFQQFEMESVQDLQPVHAAVVLGVFAVLVLFDWAKSRPPVAAAGERVLFFERQKLKLCAVHALNNLVQPSLAPRRDSE